MGTLDGVAGGVVDLAGVGAVDDYAGNAVSNSAFGEVFARGTASPTAWSRPIRLLSTKSTRPRFCTAAKLMPS
jgi:hypothetical protein